MTSILQKVIFGNSILQYGTAILAMATVWLIVRLTWNNLINLLKRLAIRTHSNLDDIVVAVFEKFLLPFLYLFVNYHILRQLNHSTEIEQAGKVGISLIILYYSLSLFNYMIHALVVLYMETNGEPLHRVNQLTGMLIVVKVISWSLGFIMLADNFGYNVTTIIAGLGVGGIAIAPAAQSILGDAFPTQKIIL